MHNIKDESAMYLLLLNTESMKIYYAFDLPNTNMTIILLLLYLTSAKVEENHTRKRKANNYGHKRKPVEQYDLHTNQTIATFDSGADAATVLGVNRTVVSLCCIGKQKGIDNQFSFRFADPAERERAENSDTFRKSYIKKQDKNVEATSKPVDVYDSVTGVAIQVGDEIVYDVWCVGNM